MPRDLVLYRAAAASIPLRNDPSFLSHRAQVSAASDRLTIANIGLNEARRLRPEDTEGAARALLDHALVIRAEVDAIVVALLARLEGCARA